MPDTEVLKSDPNGLTRASAILARGRLVAFATETVYGLGADARSGAAVAGIFAAKDRPSFNPLIVHVPDVASAQQFVKWSDTADLLASAFWPGPLTMVLPLKDSHPIAPLVSAGLGTLAIRVPAHPGAQRLLHAFGGPLAAPSANPSGRISPTTAAHVMGGLGGRIEAILDDGTCAIGLESTIVGLTADGPLLLRPGGLASEQIEAVLGYPLIRSPAPETISAPGQMASHYAPSVPMRLNAKSAMGDEVLLGFGDIKGELSLSVTGDLAEAAANLFGHLHLLDALGRPIAVAPVPTIDLGVAINDRLRRAATPLD